MLIMIKKKNQQRGIYRRKWIKNATQKTFDGDESKTKMLLQLLIKMGAPTSPTLTCCGHFCIQESCTKILEFEFDDFIKEALTYRN